jgi:hypothetical protein
MSNSSPSSTQKEAVNEKIQTDYSEFRAAARYWSGAYHGCQFGSAILSAAAALVLKLETIGDLAIRNDWGAILAALAALLITILTTGRFKEKWEANRVAAFAVRDLSYQIEKNDANLDQILTSLQYIGISRNNAILGLPADVKPKS